MQTLAIEGDLTVFTAAERKSRLLVFLRSGDALEINLAGITEIDTAGLQLLILIKREAAQTLRFVMHSKAVLEIPELTSAFGNRRRLAGAIGRRYSGQQRDESDKPDYPANASASEELAVTAEEMASQAEQLQKLMSFFKISLDNCRAEHASPRKHSVVKRGFKPGGRGYFGAYR